MFFLKAGLVLGKSIALQTLVRCMHNKLDEGNLTLGIFLDVKKAFVFVDHEILFNKLDVNMVFDGS